MILTKWVTGSILLLCSFCDGNTLYTAQKKLIDNIWDQQAACTFDFAIQNFTQAYDIFLLLQYMPDYSYQNLHIKYQLQDNQANTVETALKDDLLFDPKTGKPLGKGWGKKKYIKLPLITNYHFEKPGDYSLSVEQFMRTEKLSSIVSVGIQVCQAQPETN